MPMIKVVELKCCHRSIPLAKMYGIGSIWECPDCGEQFEIVKISMRKLWRKLKRSFLEKLTLSGYAFEDRKG